jgi:demethylmenaquinone methyltransferase/2-methoxy-6-polyprenyl-1,4-benzoquinol methylase
VKVSTVPDYYKTSYWKTWSIVYDLATWLSFIPFGGEQRFRRRFAALGSVAAKDRILDVCCGTGTLTAILAEKTGSSGELTAIDLSPHMIDKAKKKTCGREVRFIVSSSNNMPFADSSFDKVFISYGLHEQPAEIRHDTLVEIARVLRTGGTFLTLDYNMPQALFPRLAIASFVRLFENDDAYNVMKGDLVKEIEDVGFNLVERQLPLRGMFQFIVAEK